MNRIVWTNPAYQDAPKELEDAVEWDSADMARLAAVIQLRAGPVESSRYRGFRIKSENRHGKANR